jgi:hypothetical protein
MDRFREYDREGNDITSNGSPGYRPNCEFCDEPAGVHLIGDYFMCDKCYKKHREGVKPT